VNTSTTQRSAALVLQKVAAFAAIAALMALVGCADDNRNDQDPAGGGGTKTGTAAVNDADVHFASSMSPHLDQAVEMSKMLQEKDGVHPEVRSIAKQIQTTQAPQIDTLNGWLTAWGHPFGSDHDSGTQEESGLNHHGGNGLLSEAEMQALDLASGPDAQRLYVDGMVKHHQGAVAIAETEIKDGQNADAVKFARNLVQDQKHEITTMQNLRTKL